MAERIVAVDLGGTTYTVALVDTEGRIELKEEYDTRSEEGPERVLARIAEAIRKLLSDAGLTLADVRGIGLGIPGLHDTRRGVCLYASNLRWENVPVRDHFAASFGVPVAIENDVRCAALGEQHFGAGRGVGDMVLVALGTGVGGAIILNGRLVRGGFGFAGEIGHQTIDPDGLVCGCGNQGCLEAYAGARGIVYRARAAYGRRPSELIKRLAGDDLSGLSPKTLYEAAVAGDATARWLFAETGRYLGIGLSNIVSVLNPSRIVIGGGVARAGELLFGPIREEIARRAPAVMSEGLEVVGAALGPEAGVIGASTLVWSPAAQL